MVYENYSNRNKTIEKLGGCCKNCNSKDKLEIDHILPVKLANGYDSFENLQLLCRPCHSEKTKADWKKYRKKSSVYKDRVYVSRKNILRIKSLLRGDEYQNDVVERMLDLYEKSLEE